MNKISAAAASVLFLFSCTKNENPSVPDIGLTEFSRFYEDPVVERMYSTHVKDTFKIFKTIPEGYEADTSRTYPVIIILDANAFFETTVAELKFNSFLGLIPKSVVIGIGYKDFPAMDSLRSRDYTFPLAIPEYELTLSGGADRFKSFIDGELIPKLVSEYRIDMKRSAICGHSLGGYFTLYYALASMQENKAVIKNIVSASPSLHYNHRYLFDMEKGLTSNESLSLNIYVSMGSEDMNDDESRGILGSFGSQFSGRNHPGLKFKTVEFSNFGHIDAAIPGFIKGLTYIYEE
jgi:predicted alpha/beta superfamily hydrolase